MGLSIRKTATGLLVATFGLMVTTVCVNSASIGLLVVIKRNLDNLARLSASSATDTTTVTTYTWSWGIAVLALSSFIVLATIPTVLVITVLAFKEDKRATREEALPKSKTSNITIPPTDTVYADRSYGQGGASREMPHEGLEQEEEDGTVVTTPLMAEDPGFAGAIEELRQKKEGGIGPSGGGLRRRSEVGVTRS
ncbi:hypothetical protein HK101_000409 [Irineochytrium annulatum]|nr:hypothetical protein HK101_000409 [Irineochytrium annulatum]